MAEQRDDQDGSDDDAREATFDDQVEYFAKEMVLNARDIKDTYKDQPEALTAYFNAHSQAVTDSSVFICGLVAGMLALVTPWTLLATLPASAALVYADFSWGLKKCRQIENAVCKEVEAHRAATNVPVTPAPKPT
jgi:hypothetical protein